MVEIQNQWATQMTGMASGPLRGSPGSGIRPTVAPSEPPEWPDWKTRRGGEEEGRGGKKNHPHRLAIGNPHQGARDNPRAKWLLETCSAYLANRPKSVDRVALALCSSGKLGIFIFCHHRSFCAGVGEMRACQK